MFRRFVTALALLALVVGLWGFGNAPPVEPASLSVAAEPDTLAPVYARTPAPVATPLLEPEWPDRCERLWWDQERDKIRRVKRRFTDRDRREMRAWIAAVAAEFEPKDARNLTRFLWAFSVRESSYRTWVVHVLSRDQKAAERAAQRVSASGHVYAGERVDVLVDSGTRAGFVVGWRISAWTVSRGLYGMAPGSWLRVGGRWGSEIPPWALCDRRVSTALMIWAARDAMMRECRSLGFPRTYRTLNRRMSSGHCDERAPKFERAWTRRARAQGLDPDAPVKFDGKRWRERDADRGALLSHLRKLGEYGSR